MTFTSSPRWAVVANQPGPMVTSPLPSLSQWITLSNQLSDLGETIVPQSLACSINLCRGPSYKLTCLPCTCKYIVGPGMCIFYAIIYCILLLGGGGHSCAGMLTMPRIEIATIRLPVVSWADQSFGWQNPLSGQVTIAYQ